MSQMRIFLSHSSKDKAFADALVHALRQAGADVWYDEHNLGAGHLMREIMRELSARPVFVVLISKAALTSDWVHDECDWAYTKQHQQPERLLVPVVIEAYEPSDFDQMLYLEAMKRVEAPGRKPYAQEETIARTLRLLALTPAGQAPAPTAPQPEESAEDLVTRGKALSAKGQHREAIPLFERATQLTPQSFDAWHNLGYALNEIGRHADALAACDRALTIKPNNSSTWNNKGVALRELQRPQEALAAYEQALALDPKYANAWNRKGVALYDLKQYQDALVALDQAVALDPKFAAPWLWKAIILRALGRTGEAEEANRQAKALRG
jgi:tetratricopeptide (TPR) repeat protein